MVRGAPRDMQAEFAVRGDAFPGHDLGHAAERADVPEMGVEFNVPEREAGAERERSGR